MVGNMKWNEDKKKNKWEGSISILSSCLQ